jgi:hypothetical protein
MNGAEKMESSLHRQNGVDDVRVSLIVEGSTEEALEQWARKFLQGRGFSVAAPHENWETVKQFCARLRITYQTLPRNMARPACPSVLVRRGPTGRLVELLSNEQFDNFITEHKRRLHRGCTVTEQGAK